MLARTAFTRAIRSATTQIAVSRVSPTSSILRPFDPPHVTRRAASHASPDLVRWMSSKSLADEKIDEITELYSTAQDEFEIAMEETEANTVYAEDDRKAAREELGKVQAAYKKIVEGSDAALAEEVKRRIGQRIRELEKGVENMEELAMKHD